MITSLIRFVFISFLFSPAAVFSAEYVSKSTEQSALQVAPQPISNSQLPEWFYRELTSIRKDVSVLDATGASKEQIQELKERIGKVEVQFEESQLRIDGKLNEQSGRIGDIADSNSYAITLFSVIAGVLGTLIAVITIINSWKANREAVANAEEAARKMLAEWTQEKETELTKKFDQKLVELSERHEKEFQIIRNNTEEQTADNDITEAYMLANQKRDDEAVRRIHYVIQRFWGSNLIRHQKILAKAMYYRGLIFYARNQPEKEIIAYDELVELFNGHNEISIQEQLAKALLNKGFRLGQLGHPEDEIAVYDELLQQFKNNDELIIQELVARALVNKGAKLGELGRLEDAIVVYDELVKRFKNRPEFSIEKQVSIALVNKGGSLGQLNRLREAIEICDEHDNRFKGRKELDLEEQVAKNLINKGNCLSELYGPERAIQLYNELIIRLKDRKEPSLEEELATALLNKGFALNKLFRYEETIAVLDELIKRFKNSDIAAIQEWVFVALANKAELVLAAGDKEEAKKAIYDAIIFMKDGYKEQRAVMEMLSFIIEESTADEVLGHIYAISDGEVDQSFDPIRSVIESLESPHKEQVEAFARYFEDHHNKAKLKEELDQISKL